MFVQKSYSHLVQTSSGSEKMEIKQLFTPYQMFMWLWTSHLYNFYQWGCSDKNTSIRCRLNTKCFYSMYTQLIPKIETNHDIKPWKTITQSYYKNNCIQQQQNYNISKKTAILLKSKDSHLACKYFIFEKLNQLAFVWAKVVMVISKTKIWFGHVWECGYEIYTTPLKHLPVSEDRKQVLPDWH